MLPPIPAPSLPAGPAAPAPGSDAARLREAAQGFEALLLRQMLAAADRVDFGGRDLFGSSAGDTFREMRNAEWARAAASAGAFGLAAQIEAQVARLQGLRNGDGG